MAILKRGPFRQLRELERQLDDLFQGQGGDDTKTGNGSASLSSWKPRVDVYEEGEELVFEVDAPGLDKEDLDVSIEDNRLTVSGQRREEKNVEDADRNYFRSERIYGTFKRSFALPDSIDRESIEANYDNGVLTIRAAQTAESRSQEVQIQ